MTDALRAVGMFDPVADPSIFRAGGDEGQRRLGLLAWEMVEIWKVPSPHRGVATRFSTEWLRQRNWKIAFLPDTLRPEEEARFFNAVRDLGHEPWLGTAVDPDLQELTAVWSIGFGEGDLQWFHAAHGGTWVMGFTAERDFAFLGDGDGGGFRDFPARSPGRPAGMVGGVRGRAANSAVGGEFEQQSLL
ncbi:hypothetical protein QMO56_08010 [Roseomonas sp. E05]|uniref:hypothetical protein n=1 Tax=Roseomonas sp. E05 TaxID=3046310 RepID=UPI0024B935DE|nr:hypothetical protein [Roseomonas sp. E05]MDJ0388056.1 hypothetical protein [Roseomonas sp. E05]